MRATDLRLRRWRGRPINWNHWHVIGNCVPISPHHYVPLDEVDASPSYYGLLESMQSCLWSYCESEESF
jgi:hypothetical protein